MRVSQGAALPWQSIRSTLARDGPMNELVLRARSIGPTPAIELVRGVLDGSYSLRNGRLQPILDAFHAWLKAQLTSPARRPSPWLCLRASPVAQGTLPGPGISRAA
jgi:hypothetical protein